MAIVARLESSAIHYHLNSASPSPSAASASPGNAGSVHGSRDQRRRSSSSSSNSIYRASRNANASSGIDSLLAASLFHQPPAIRKRPRMMRLAYSPASSFCSSSSESSSSSSSSSDEDEDDSVSHGSPLSRRSLRFRRGNNAPSSLLPRVRPSLKSVRFRLPQDSATDSDSDSDAGCRPHGPDGSAANVVCRQLSRDEIQALKTTLWWSKSDRSRMLQHARAMALTYKEESPNLNKQRVRRQLEATVRYCRFRQHHKHDDDSDDDTVYHCHSSSSSSSFYDFKDSRESHCNYSNNCNCNCSNSNNYSDDDDDDDDDDESEQDDRCFTPNNPEAPVKLAMPGLARGLEPLICSSIAQMRRQHVETVLRAQEYHRRSRRYITHQVRRRYRTNDSVAELIGRTSSKSSQPGRRLARQLALGDQSLVYPNKSLQALSAHYHHHHHRQPQLYMDSEHGNSNDNDNSSNAIATAFTSGTGSPQQPKESNSVHVVSPVGQRVLLFPQSNDSNDEDSNKRRRDVEVSCPEKRVCLPSCRKLWTSSH